MHLIKVAFTFNKFLIPQKALSYMVVNVWLSDYQIFSLLKWSFDSVMSINECECMDIN